MRALSLPALSEVPRVPPPLVSAARERHHTVIQTPAVPPLCRSAPARVPLLQREPPAPLHQLIAPR